jgi:hypothetical protein
MLRRPLFVVVVRRNATWRKLASLACAMCVVAFAAASFVHAQTSPTATTPPTVTPSTPPTVTPSTPPTVTPPPPNATSGAPTTCRTAACHAALFSVTPLSVDEVKAMTGVVWRPGCPVPLSKLRNVGVGTLGEDGAVHAGTLVVHEAVADDVVAVFRALLDDGFVVARAAPATVTGGDDVALMRENITSAFNCRPVTGGRGFSPHSWGVAVDINPLWNPYVKRGVVSPPEAAPFAVDRERAARPGMLLPGSAVVAAFERRGWSWGGRWRSLKDWQHVEKKGAVAANADGTAPDATKGIR